jgi:hypothetical protein
MVAAIYAGKSTDQSSPTTGRERDDGLQRSEIL